MSSDTINEAEVEVIEQKDECGELFAKPSSKMLENRASISSVDSSISLSYDAVPFTPRGSLTIGSGTDDELKHDNRFSSTDSSSDAAVSGNESKKIKTSNGGSSGDDRVGDRNEEPFDPPDDELRSRIVDQVEYYFSDENIVKDAFLLKHVRRNKEGYVSLKLIASFKRVKHIARDWRVVRVALEKSDKLEINEAGTKLRRKDPLPLYDQTTPSRTVVAVDIPPEKATIESVAEMFRQCGEIALVRILRPGNPIPSDVRPFYNKHPEMHDKVSALIEFVRTESAHNALSKDADAAPKFNVQVLELNAPSTKKKFGIKKFPTSSRVFDSEFSSSCQSGSESEDRYRFRAQRRCSSPHLHQPQKPLPAAEQIWAAQRRWSRDSGSESPGSSFSRSRSNSGVYFVPEQRRMSAGWDSSSESYSSYNRSRSSSGASIPDVFQMRRYSLPRKEPSCCCCGFPKCESITGGRRFSIGRHSDDGGGGGGGGGGCGFNQKQLSRCNSTESSEGGCQHRKESIPEFYPLHRGSGSYERRHSLSKNGDGCWSRSSSLSSAADSNGRRLSDSEGRVGLIRQRSFGNNIGNLSNSETIVRLPRGPDGGRGFQRELIDYALPE